MTVLFNFSLQTPVSDGDREILVALSVLAHAIATHKAGEPFFPGGDDDIRPDMPDPDLQPCDFILPDGSSCVMFKGHREPHYSHEGGVN
jgi:hypothetical protein